MTRHSGLAACLLASTLVLAGALAACGDDSTSPPTDSGPGRTDGGPSGTDSGPSGTDSGPSGTDSGPTAMGMCTNAADMATLGSMDVSTIAGTCARTCFLRPEAERAMCVTDCIVMMTNMMLSRPCAECFTGAAGCAATNCIAMCLAGDSPACTACQCGMNDAMVNCRAMFTTCSGVSDSACM